MCAASSLCAAQSLGDLARQERARRAQQKQHAPLITNEDLKREHILPVVAPVAQAPVTPAIPDAPSSAALPVSTRPGPGVPLWHVADQPGFSLGSYARALREQKRQRDALQNAMGLPRPEIDRGASALVRSVSRPALADLPAVVRHAPARREVVAERKAKVSAPKLRSAPRIVRHATSRHLVRTQEPDPTRVIVQPGDSLWRIAADVFGDGRLWTALWHANPGVRNPNLIYAGQTLRLPTPVQISTLRGKLQAAAAHSVARSLRTSAAAHRSLAPRSSAPAARLETAPVELPRQ